jgi:hypothetical protein
VTAKPHARLEERLGAIAIAREDDAEVAYLAKVCDRVDSDGDFVVVGCDLKKGDVRP